MVNAFKFSTLSAAEECHYNMTEYSKHTIVLGDDGKFWIVTNKEASRLIKQGYEFA